jgi:hypothetical protein
MNREAQRESATEPATGVGPAAAPTDTAPADADVEAALAAFASFTGVFTRLVAEDDGALHALAQSCVPLDLPALAAWQACLEHGSFHGLMTAFCAFAISSETDFAPQPGPWLQPTPGEALLLSCYLHDFARIQGPVEGHDARLAAYFPDLLPETYEHSAPTRLSTLVKADRLELQRYPDHREWCVLDMLKPCATSDQWRLIAAFYGSVRPALQRLVAQDQSGSRTPCPLPAQLAGDFTHLVSRLGEVMTALNWRSL